MREAKERKCGQCSEVRADRDGGSDGINLINEAREVFEGEISV